MLAVPPFQMLRPTITTFINPKKAFCTTWMPLGQTNTFTPIILFQVRNPRRQTTRRVSFLKRKDSRRLGLLFRNLFWTIAKSIKISQEISWTRNLCSQFKKSRAVRPSLMEMPPNLIVLHQYQGFPTRETPPWVSTHHKLTMNCLTTRKRWPVDSNQIKKHSPLWMSA